MDEAPTIGATPAETRPPWYAAPWIGRSKVRTDFECMHRMDARGDRFHLAFALLWGVLIGGPRLCLEMAMLPLAGCWLVRLWYMRRAAMWPLFWPISLALVAWAAWIAASLLWTSDVTNGLRELSYMRHAAPLLLLWPAIAHRAKVIVAMNVGFSLLVLSQLGIIAGEAWNMPWLAWAPSHDGRVGGWNWVMQTGELLAVMFAINAPAAVLGRGREAGVAGVFAGVFALGVVLSGTRAAVIVVGAIVLIVICVALRRRETRSRGLIGAGVVGVAAAGVLLSPLGSVLLRKGEEAFVETRRAITEGHYATASGGRLKLMEWGWEQFAQRPIHGAGAGSFRWWVEANVSEAEGGAVREHFVALKHLHPHNTLLHIGGTQGIVGVLLFAGVFVIALAGAARQAHGRWGTLHAGPFYALIACVMLMPFDALTGSSRMAALFFAIIALCAPIRADEIGEERVVGASRS